MKWVMRDFVCVPSAVKKQYITGVFHVRKNIARTAEESCLEKVLLIISCSCKNR